MMRYWLPVLAYMALLFFLSSRPALPELPKGLSYYHVHAVTYAGLGVTTLRALAQGLRRPSWLAVCGAVVIASIYGATDEYHQAFVPGRNAEVLDVVADAIGAIVGAVAIKAWSIIGRR